MKCIAYVIAIIIPGGIFLFTKRPWIAIFPFFLALLFLILFSQLGLIYSKLGLLILTGLIISVFVSTNLVGLAFWLNDKIGLSNRRLMLLFSLIFAESGLLGLTLFFKELLLGAAIYQISSFSMLPTFIPGDLILVNLSAYKADKPQNGDIVLFQKSYDKLVYIKRVAGTKGETATWEDRQGNSHEVKIDPGSVFMLGDNPKYSSDSRDFGTVPINQILGKAELILISIGADWTIRKKRFLAKPKEHPRKTAPDFGFKMVP